MITMSYQARVRNGAGTLLTVMALVSACSSGGHSASSATATQQTCQQVSAVLANGPDPDADPVGYAEAQILPLKQIHAPDPALGQAITVLAGAYSGFLATNGTSSAAKTALKAASNKINSICPGAAS